MERWFTLLRLEHITSIAPYVFLRDNNIDRQKQLSKIPKSMMSQGIITDKPDTASDTFTAELQPGDIVVLYVSANSDFRHRLAC